MNLQENTLLFWRVSLAWHHPEIAHVEKVTVAGALGVLRKVRMSTDPNRPLGKRVASLTEAIVLHQDDSASHLTLEDHSETAV